MANSTSILHLPFSIPTVQVKLNGQNYMFWKDIMSPLLETYGILSYAEGRIPEPSKTVTRPDGSVSQNPEHQQWVSRYKFALTCIMLANAAYNAVTEDIGITILSAKTSHEAWHSLETAFLSQTATQEDLLEQQWRDLRKGSLSMLRFINEVKKKALNFAQIEKPKTPIEINRHIYTNLGPEWEPFILAKSDTMITMSIDELTSLLMEHDDRRSYAAIHEQLRLISLVSLDRLPSKLIMWIVEGGTVIEVAGRTKGKLSAEETGMVAAVDTTATARDSLAVAADSPLVVTGMGKEALREDLIWARNGKP
ncbi:hypothetical protein CRG98_034400 [Punica granatum]|uniref:Retrotransposon Copia-like N-terminal domain-containing protein n=1 Tax=Punica granatum TaxID=22663 RepID=A0A2I0IMK1_PUNGR|nr:hypothetical protein CRG98_034400 [Punica granatum]